MSTIKANQWLNPDGTENYKCREWVLFNGVTNTILAQKNILSFTDRGVGLYSFTMTTPSDAYYCVVVSGNSAQNIVDTNVAQTSSVFNTSHSGSTGTANDATYCSAVVFS